MNPASSATSHSFHFYLTGQAANKPKYHYVAELLPGKEKGIAKVTTSKAKEAHSWQVIYSQSVQEMTIAKIFDYIGQQSIPITVTKEKSRKQLNLDVKADPASEKDAVQVIVEVEGTTSEAKPYLLQLYPNNLQASQAYLREVQGHLTPIRLDLGILSQYSTKQFQNLLLKGFERQIKAEIKQKSLGACLCLSAQKEDSIDLLSLQNAKDLVDYLNQVSSPDPLAYKIAKAMVDDFTQRQQPSAKAINEMSILFGKLEEYDQIRVLKCLMKHFLENPFKDEKILGILTEMLVHLQKGLYLRQVETELNSSEGFYSLSTKFLENLDSTHLAKLLELLTSNLTASARPQNLALLKNHLKALSALLEVMVVKEVQSVEQHLYLTAYQALSEFTKHEDLEVAYLARYGRSAFDKLSDDKTALDTAKSISSRTFHVLRGFARIADGVSLVEPWHVASAFDGFVDLKKALSFQGPLLPKWCRKKAWFINLIALRTSFFTRPAEFFNVISSLNTADEYAKPKLLHHPFFLTGLVDLLWEALHFPPSSSQVLELKKTALEVLQSIYQANHLEKSAAFRLKAKEYRAQIAAIVKDYLLTCKTHPELEVSQLAACVLKTLNLDDAITSKPFSPPISSELFKQAIRQVPLFQALRQVSDQLKKDSQLQKESVYYILPNARNALQGFATPHPLEECLKDFLQSDTPVLLLEGDGGAGKTLSMKMLAAQLLQNYAKENYFPIYTYLARLENPVKKALEEAFALYGITDDQALKLKKRRLVLICDAYDEINFNKLPDATTVNLYETNQFANKGIAKVIFVRKKGIGRIENFKPKRASIQNMALTPFDKKQIFSYIDNFISQRQKDKKNPLLWTAKEYHENIEKLKKSVGKDLLTNPFRLYITAEALPLLVRKYQETDPGKDFKEMIKKKDKLVLEKDLFDVFTCAQAFRSSLKEENIDIDPKAFLKYATDLAAKMEEYELTAIPYTQSGDEISHSAVDRGEGEVSHLTAAKGKGKLDEETTARPKEPTSSSNANQDEIKEIIKEFFNESQVRFYKECLILKDNGWAFIHQDYQHHLAYYGMYPETFETFEKILKEYDFAKWLFS